MDFDLDMNLGSNFKALSRLQYKLLAGRKNSEKKGENIYEFLVNL
tara:strand:- start:3664 stop:3798 length:135 start_codon:yes stop_codon:yes gene_type:complete